MTLTPIAVLQDASARGLKLEVHGDELHVIPAERVPADFVPILKDHKAALIALLKLRMVMVDSAAVGEMLFFAEDEQTKRALCAAGAEEWSVYTRDELRVLCELNRAAPLTAQELQKVHEIRRTFRATIKPR
jgi:hypothetical protein